MWFYFTYYSILNNKPASRHVTKSPSRHVTKSPSLQVSTSQSRPLAKSLSRKLIASKQISCINFIFHIAQLFRATIRNNDIAFFFKSC